MDVHRHRRRPEINQWHDAVKPPNGVKHPQHMKKERCMKILVGYDGSNSAKDALTLATKHAAAFNAQVIVISSLTGGNVTHAVEVEHATEDLENAKKMVEDAGIACDTKLLVRGMTPGEDVVEFAKEQAVDEIVIGIKRRSKVGKLLFGSNAQYIIIKAPCPVVTVK
jgi:nucleotide-binding universal stress UspA family protein